MYHTKRGQSYLTGPTAAGMVPPTATARPSATVIATSTPELRAPVATSEGQQHVWVSTGTANWWNETGTEYILCCHEGEEKCADAEALPDLGTVSNLSNANVAAEKPSVIPSTPKWYCLDRCRWIGYCPIISYL